MRSSASTPRVAPHFFLETPFSLIHPLETHGFVLGCIRRQLRARHRHKLSPALSAPPVTPSARVRLPVLSNAVSFDSTERPTGAACLPCPPSAPAHGVNVTVLPDGASPGAYGQTCPSLGSALQHCHGVDKSKQFLVCLSHATRCISRNNYLKGAAECEHISDAFLCGLSSLYPGVQGAESSEHPFMGRAPSKCSQCYACRVNAYVRMACALPIIVMR